MKAFMLGILGASLVVGFPYIVGFFMVAWEIILNKIFPQPSGHVQFAGHSNKPKKFIGEK